MGTGNVTGSTNGNTNKPVEKSFWTKVIEVVDSILDPNGVKASDAQRAKQIDEADKKRGYVVLPTPNWRPGNADFKGSGKK